MDIQAVNQRVAERRDRSKGATFLTDFNRRHYTIHYDEAPKFVKGGPQYTYLGQRRWKTKSGKPIL